MLQGDPLHDRQLVISEPILWFRRRGPDRFADGHDELDRHARSSARRGERLAGVRREPPVGSLVDEPEGEGPGPEGGGKTVHRQPSLPHRPQKRRALGIGFDQRAVGA